MSDNNSDTSGIIELSIRGEWRSVCDDLWSNANAVVACRQLGLPHNRKLSVFYVYVLLSDSFSNHRHACAFSATPTTIQPKNDTNCFNAKLVN